MSKVYVKAVAFGTTALASGTIVHFDPDSDDKRAHGGVFDEAEGLHLEKQGLGKIDTSKKVTEEDGRIVITAEDSGMDLRQLEDNVAGVTGADDEMRGPSSLNSMSTTAFPQGHIESSGLQQDEERTGSPSAADLSPAVQEQLAEDAEIAEADKGTPPNTPAPKAPAKKSAATKKAAAAPAKPKGGLGSGERSGTAKQEPAADAGAGENGADAGGDAPPA